MGDNRVASGCRGGLPRLGPLLRRQRLLLLVAERVEEGRGAGTARRGCGAKTGCAAGRGDGRVGAGRRRRLAPGRAACGRAAADGRGRTPLHFAAMGGDTAVVDALLAAGGVRSGEDFDLNTVVWSKLRVVMKPLTPPSEAF